MPRCTTCNKVIGAKRTMCVECAKAQLKNQFDPEYNPTADNGYDMRGLANHVLREAGEKS